VLLKSKFNNFCLVDCVPFQQGGAVFILACKLLLLTLLMFLSLPAVSGHEVPKEIDGAEVISAEGLFDEALAHPELVIVDARHKGDRVQGYIEGSINLPDTDTDCGSLAKIIPSYGNPAMFYCNGVMCARSATAIHKAVACGYKNVYWLRGGFNEWKAKGFPYLSK